MIRASYSVFVSHSKSDLRKDFFTRSFATAGVKGEFEEFEPESSNNTPPWKKIKEHVRLSRGTFVVLSEPLENIDYRHTMNWIDFEVGLSAALGKPVWVFEPDERRIDFSVPYVTHQLYYDYTSDVQIKWLVSVLRGGILWFKLQDREFTCPKCGLKFFQLNDFKQFTCPSCRTPLEIP